MQNTVNVGTVGLQQFVNITTATSFYFASNSADGNLKVNDTEEGEGGNFSLEATLGLRYRPLGESVLLIIVYVIIFITGVIGNVITCVVIARNSYMQTATNYYLFSLAVSDLLTLFFGLPPELYTVWEAYPWRFGSVYCLLKTFITEATAAASVLTITAFTVERFIAICYPLRAHTLSSLPRAVRVIVMVWVCACLSALPYPLYTRTYHARSHPTTNDVIAESFICNIPYAWYSDMTVVFWLSFIVLFLLPLCAISTLYVIIGITLHRSAQHRSATVHVLPRPSKQGVINMLVAVVVAFFFCWAPYHAQRLMTVSISYDRWTPPLLELQNILFYMSGIFFYISATVNPILYNVMSKKFRRGFGDTLCRCFADKLRVRRRFDSPTQAGVVEPSFTFMSHGTAVTHFGSSRRSLAATCQPSTSCLGALSCAGKSSKSDFVKRQPGVKGWRWSRSRSHALTDRGVNQKRRLKDFKEFFNFRRQHFRPKANVRTIARRSRAGEAQRPLARHVNGSVYSVDSTNSYSMASFATHIGEELEQRNALPAAYYALLLDRAPRY